MEEKLRAGKSPEDNLFYYHSSEDRIVLSHALFWVMTQSLKGKIAKEKNVLLLRQYEEEMLDAYLTEDAYFPELLRYCNIMFEFLPIILHHMYDFASDKAARKLATIAIVAAGYGGDMPEDLNGLGTGSGVCEGASLLAFKNGLGPGFGLFEETKAWGRVHAWRGKGHYKIPACLGKDQAQPASSNPLSRRSHL